MTKYIITVLIVSFFSVWTGFTAGYVNGWETGLRTGQVDSMMLGAGMIIKHFSKEYQARIKEGKK